MAWLQQKLIPGTFISSVFIHTQHCHIDHLDLRSTWPLVQLPGLAGSSAVVLSLSMITLYLAYALLAGSPLRFTTVRRSKRVMSAF